MRIKSCNITRAGGEPFSAISDCLKAAIELAASSSLIFTLRWIAEKRDIVKVREDAGNEIVVSKQMKRMEKKRTRTKEQASRDHPRELSLV